MTLVGLRHHDNPFVVCGTSLSACENCPDRCVPLEQVRLVWANAVNGDDEGHYHNDDKVISVTETLLCTLKSVLARTVDYSESPKALSPRAAGTAMHKAMEAVNDDGCSEVMLTKRLSRGFSLMGTADRLTDDYVMDYKSMDSFRKTVDLQHEEQLSIYGEMAGGGRKLLLAQMTRKGIQIMEIEPIDGALDACIERAERMIDVLTGDAELESLPPLGREIKFFRNRQCDYCPYEIKKACDKLHPSEE